MKQQFPFGVNNRASVTAAHAIFHHIVAPGHMGYRQILTVWRSISLQCVRGLQQKQQCWRCSTALHTVFCVESQFFRAVFLFVNTVNSPWIHWQYPHLFIPGYRGGWPCSSSQWACYLWYGQPPVAGSTTDRLPSVKTHKHRQPFSLASNAASKHSDFSHSGGIALHIAHLCGPDHRL